MRHLYDELDDMYDLLYKDGCKLESLRGALQRSQEAMWLLYREAMHVMAVAFESRTQAEMKQLRERLHVVFEKAVEAGGHEDIYDAAYHGGISRGHSSEASELRRLKKKQICQNVEETDELLDDCS